jgi:hypothetical protein
MERSLCWSVRYACTLCVSLASVMSQYVSTLGSKTTMIPLIFRVYAIIANK